MPNLCCAGCVDTCGTLKFIVARNEGIGAKERLATAASRRRVVTACEVDTRGFIVTAVSRCVDEREARGTYVRLGTVATSQPW